MSHPCPGRADIHPIISTSASTSLLSKFPPLTSPPPRPNTDPRCNLPSRTNDTPIRSSLNPDAWQIYLQHYPDRELVKTLLHIIKYGASVGFSGTGKSQICKNLRSALDYSDFVSQKLQDSISKQHVHGPFPSPPLPDFVCSPLGTVTRPRNPSKRRVINHLSWPRMKSVNDGIPDSEGKIKYEMFEEAVRALVNLGPGSLLAKLDLKDAFHHIPVRAADWHLLGFKWNNAFYYAVVLSFGLKSAPYIFNLFAEALHWIIQRHIPATIKHYLDDFFGRISPLDAGPICLRRCCLDPRIGPEFGSSLPTRKDGLAYDQT